MNQLLSDAMTVLIALTLVALVLSTFTIYWVIWETKKVRELLKDANRILAGVARRSAGTGPAAAGVATKIKAEPAAAGTPARPSDGDGQGAAQLDAAQRGAMQETVPTREAVSKILEGRRTKHGRTGQTGAEAEAAGEVPGGGADATRKVKARKAGNARVPMADS